MNTNTKGAFAKNRLIGSSMLALAMISATPAWAQEATDETAKGEPEIVVTGQFLNTGASSATKLDIPVLDTPFSVSAYNAEFMKAIETTSVSDLYRYMTGVQRAGNTGYDVTLRGFKSGGGDRNSIMTDGMPGLSVRFGSPPTIGVDHVEVVKGPTSVLYGQAQPGGFINIISKKPSARRHLEVNLKGATGIGPLNRARSFTGSFDVTGPIDADGALTFRVVAEAGDIKGFRDYAYEHPVYIAPSLAWKIADGTKLTLMGEHRATRTHYDNYLVVPNRDVSLITNYTASYQSPNDYQIERGTVGTVLFEHEFSSALKFNAAYRYVDHFDSAFGYDNNTIRTVTQPGVPTLLGRRARGQENIRTYGFLDVNMSADFEMLGIGHKLIVGGTIGKETSNFNRTQFYTAPATGANSLDINIQNPVHNEQPLSFYPLCNTGTGLTVAICSAAGSSLTWRDSTQKSKGAYISDLITLHKMFKVMLGLRYADEQQDSVELRIPGSPAQSKRDTAWLPLAGLIFQPQENISIYGSFSTSFVPVAASQQDVFGLNPFRPTKAESIEGGIKAELFDKRLTATLAYFDIKKKDTINTFTCPANLAALNAYITANAITAPSNAPRDTAGNLVPATGTCSAPIGGERSKGFEFEVSANPVEGWSLAFGYAHTQARVSKSNVATQNGARLTNAPDDAFNIWSRYDFQDGALKGLGFGIGIAYVGERVGYLPAATVPTNIPASNELLSMKAFTLVDLGLYYKVSEHTDLTFKVSNLFDKRYIESTGFSGDIQMLPGQPRLATFSMRFGF